MATLVTGGSGVLGLHVARCLGEKGEAVVAYSTSGAPGHADILLQNGQQLAEWRMNGTQMLPGSGNINPALSAGWSVV